MKIKLITSRKHPGAIFLLDEDTSTYILKVYNIPNGKEVANEIQQLLNNKDKDK